MSSTQENIVRDIQHHAETARGGDTMPLRSACEQYLPDVRAFDRIMDAIRPLSTNDDIRRVAGREACLVLAGK